MKKFTVELEHNWNIEPSPWGQGLLLVSYYGYHSESARVCSARCSNMPDEEDVLAAMGDGWDVKWRAVVTAAMDLHKAMQETELSDAAGTMMTQVQTALIESIAWRAERCWTDRVMPPT